MSSHLSYRVILQPCEDGYLASVPALPEVQSFGTTKEQAKARIAEAIELVVAQSGDLVPPDFAQEPVVDVVAIKIPSAN